MGKLAPGGSKVWSVYKGNGGWIARGDTGRELLVMSSSTVFIKGSVLLHIPATANHS